VTEEDKNFLQVNLCGTTLFRLTATWYADKVEDWNQKTKHWYFDDLVCTLYKGFIHEVMAQNAANSYERTRFSQTKGTLLFFNDMKGHASRMVQPPDEYSMKRKFLEGLPDDIIGNLFKARCMSAEHMPLRKLLR
jgi:hypothetical protein